MNLALSLRWRKQGFPTVQEGGYTDDVSVSVTSIRPDQLMQMELFRDLPVEALAEIVAMSEVRHLTKGSMLFAQGTAADRCHALLAGRVRIAQSGEAGEQLIVRFVGPGQMFGTMTLFTDRRYPGEAVAVIDSVEICWTEAVLLALIQRYPQIALNLVRVAAARLGEIQQRLREIATERVDRRIAHTLLRLAHSNAHPNSAAAEIDFPLRRQDVAQMCGATLYTVSRILKFWERRGLITTRRGHLSIRRLAELRRIAGVPLD